MNDCDESSLLSKTVMYNLRKKVIFISFCPVQVVNFTKEHNLLLTIMSSGHEYTCRSSYDGSVLLSMERMKDRQVNLDSDRSLAGEIKAQTGNRWLDLYMAVSITFVLYLAVILNFSYFLCPVTRFGCNLHTILYHGIKMSQMSVLWLKRLQKCQRLDTTSK